jgi:hypothetical protein
MAHISVCFGAGTIPDRGQHRVGWNNSSDEEGYRQKADDGGRRQCELSRQSEPDLPCPHGGKPPTGYFDTCQNFT